MIDTVHIADLTDNYSDIFYYYFHLHILQHIFGWKNILEMWYLVCYSVQHNITCLQAKYSVPVVRIFQYKKKA